MNDNKLAKYLVLDLETSGLKPDTNGIIQLACIAVDRNLKEIATYATFVLPPEGTIYDATADLIHGIKYEKLINEGLGYTDLCEEFLMFIKTHFELPPIIIGQFFPFEYNFINSLFDSTLGEDDRLYDSKSQSYGIFQKIVSRSFIDTKSLCTFINMKAEIDGNNPIFVTTSLSSPNGVKSVLGIDSSIYKAHDALGDCQATLDVLQRITNKTNILF